MKKLVTTFALLAACAGSAFASNPVRISQVYAGGGTGFGGGVGATYAYDYVELFNHSNVPVVINGWTLQYGAGTSLDDLGTCPTCLTILSGVIQPCSYYLVQLANGSTQPFPQNPLPVPADASGTTDLDPLGGKIALRASLQTGPCGGHFGPPIVDLVGWGTANCSEGSPIGRLVDNLTSDPGIVAAVRNGGGDIDTDQNSLDFTIVRNPVPHDSQSPPNPACVTEFSCQISGWSPDPVCPGGQLTVFGSQFPAGAQITVVNLGTGNPYPLAMIFQSANEIVGVVPTNTPAGNYGILVNPGNCNSGPAPPNPFLTIGSPNCPTPAPQKSWGFVKSIYR